MATGDGLEHVPRDDMAALRTDHERE